MPLPSAHANCLHFKCPPSPPTPGRVLFLSEDYAHCVKTECAAATQIAKMTPFRSFCVVVVTALTLTIMALLQLKGGTITYVIVSLSFCTGCALRASALVSCQTFQREWVCGQSTLDVYVHTPEVWWCATGCLHRHHTFRM